MNLKLQLKILSFLQFCLWGSWLTTLGSYMFVTLKFDGASIGAVYSSLGIAAVFMPTLLGIVADKWLSAKWVYALCHVVGAVTLFMAAEVTTPGAMFFVILLNSLAYMPTLGLINTISYYRLQSAGMDIVTDFPPIRIWGTIGFILAMWGGEFLRFRTEPYATLYRRDAFRSAGTVYLYPAAHSGGEPAEKPELDINAGP
ncbi:nucleoside permease [Salmonella enterica subsp. arizonae]|nr:nucleoside permease [Salmonella enterica subsp. arizonae]